MGTRVIEMGAKRWTVRVNAEEVTPEYPDEAKAIARAEREARTKHHVQVTVSTGNTRPRNVATWVDGVRQDK